MSEINWSEKLNQLNGWSFGDNAEMADELGKLVLEGKKTATTSLYHLYEQDSEPLPKVGAISFIKDSQGNPLCVVQITKVEIKPFKSVDADFAFQEGEGDRSLEYWRNAHIEFFSKYCAFNESLDVVCETFRVIHKFSKTTADK